MTLILSTADVARLEEAHTAILSLLAHDSAADWHAKVSDVLRELVGADHASLFESGPAPVVHLSTHDEAAARDYVAHHVHRDPVTSALAAADIECGCSWDVITPRDFRRTEFYHDYVRRHALYDGLGYRVRSGPDSHAWLTFHYAQEQDEDAVRRRASLLRLLLPAFRAGVQLDRRLGEWRRGAVQSLDEQGDAVMLCSASGRVLHANPALRRLVDADPEGPELWSAMTALARELSQAAAGMPVPTATRQVRTALGTYAAVALLAGPLLTPAHVTVVLQPIGVSGDELRQRFGLTAREVQVARLLALGRRNAELAHELGISEFTARRHTERVLRKLGVESRAQVAGRLGG